MARGVRVERSRRILAIEPYGGGSHLAFLGGWAKHSRHELQCTTLAARHWKWRMRSGPLAINQLIAERDVDSPPPDLVFASEMLDVPTWLGFASRHPALHGWISSVPLVTYFHENQWAYPKAPEARVDHHYAYTNLLSALLSDACWFNSQFNLETFFRGSAAFLKRMPDSVGAHDLEAARERSKVIPPGFQPPSSHRRDPDPHHRLVIGWVSRLDHDKRPDRFVDVLNLLLTEGVDFELVLLGQRASDDAVSTNLFAAFQDRIRFNGYAETTEEYHRHLSSMDVVVSTAEHEFFGIAMCETIWAGAIPVVPNDLSYPEYVPDRLRFETLEQAAKIIQRLGTEIEQQATQSLLDECRSNIADFQIEFTSHRLDHEVDLLCDGWKEPDQVR